MRISDWSSDVCSSDLPLAGSLRALTFSRAADAQVPPLAPMLSDPIDYPVTAGERLAHPVYFPEKTAPPAHAQMVDIVAGDASGRWEERRVGTACVGA